MYRLSTCLPLSSYINKFNLGSERRTYLFEKVDTIVVHLVTSSHEEDLTQHVEIFLNFALCVQALNESRACSNVYLSQWYSNTFFNEVFNSEASDLN